MNGRITSTKHYLEFIVVKILSQIVIVLPWKLNYWLANRLGELSYIFLRKRRRLTIDNLRQAFSSCEGSEKGSSQELYNQKEIKRLAKNTFRNFAKNMIEFISSPKINKDNVDNFVTITGLENLEEAKNKGKGVIIITGHLGNWELMSRALTIKGYPLNIMIRRQRNVLVEALIERQRRDSGLKTFPHTTTPNEIFKMLKNNEIIGLIADQDGGEKGIFLDFFGKPASTIPSPVIFALRSQAALVPLFDIRLKNNHHLVTIEPPYQLSHTADIKRDVVDNTQILSKKLELYIRQYPDQWFWLHNRWATKPSLSGRVNFEGGKTL
jgi:KDO2-lipid IV(A) lauroyltransferase